MQTKIVIKYLENVDYRYSYLVGIEAGALELVKHGIKLDLAISDFDSVDDTDLIKQNSLKFKQLDTKKDFTDLESALIELDKFLLSNVLVIGGLEGERLDHFLTNVILAFKYKLSFIDERSKLLYVEKGIYELKKDDYRYFSFYAKKGTKINFDSNFLYSGKHRFSRLDTKFISNELTADAARFQVSKPCLVLISK